MNGVAIVRCFDASKADVVYQELGSLVLAVFIMQG